MGKLALDPNPTFVKKVDIPVPGAEAAAVSFTFKHRDRDALKAFMETVSELDPGAMVLEVATAWDLDDKFTIENAQRLVKNYMGAARAVYETYIEELGQVRLGN